MRKLLEVLHALVETGNTVLVIEHNLEVIKTADWIIDLGPEGGDGGGHIVATGTPEDIASSAASYTGQYLRPYLARRRGGGEPGELAAFDDEGAAGRVGKPIGNIFWYSGDRTSASRLRCRRIRE